MANEKRRNRLVVLGVFTILAASLGCGLGRSRDKSGNPAVRPVEFQEIAKGIFSGVREMKFVQVQSQQELEDLLQQHQSDGTADSIDFPQIDFEQDMLLAVFLGAKGNNCDNHISINQILESESGLEVHIQFSIGSAVCKRGVFPFQIIKMVKTSKPVIFIPKEIKE